MDEMSELKKLLNPSEILFVADAMTGQDAVNSAKAFNDRLSITGAILTKMDGDARGGAALSIRQITGAPIKFLGTGEKPDAFEPFHPDRIVSRIMGMGDIATLLERAEDKLDRGKAEQFAKKALTGQGFTLEDFREQLRQIKKMGSMKSILKMLPSVGPFAGMAQAAENVDEIPVHPHRVHHQLHDQQGAPERRPPQRQPPQTHRRRQRHLRPGGQQPPPPIHPNVQNVQNHGRRHVRRYKSPATHDVPNATTKTTLRTIAPLRQSRYKEAFSDYSSVYATRCYYRTPLNGVLSKPWIKIPY